MITNFQKFKFIKESPDTLSDDDNDNEYIFGDDDARPFLADVNFDHTEVKKVYVGGYRDWHSDMSDNIEGEINKAYAGRLWEDSKIMSFWVYPTVDLFKQIISGIEDELDIQIFNNGWRLEVITDEESGDIKRRKYKAPKPPRTYHYDDDNNYVPDDDDDEDEDEDDYDDFDDDYFRPDDQERGDNTIIPLDKYDGSEDVSEEKQIQHLMKWQEKELAKKLGKMHFPRGFGSDKTAWDSPHNIKWRQAKYQENKIYK